ncbi:hypothetical protein BS47DRAFT_1364296 [Hydnum rufescens UP504]|uniref:Uncharacterized protein n=1 Tax=Hydnum rufescens UP504 TaxID=1448309 RepID=A0A9P6DUM8_9AGAM|nr:hypothetical protein BS47DRAFT_1364296 [Hydnum rufescens UP504]
MWKDSDEILNSPITLPLRKILGAAGEVSKNINQLTKTAKQESPDQAPANIHEARSVAANDEWGDSEYDSDDESEKEHIRAMIDTGSELNLMSCNLQEELRLPLDPAGAAWGIKGVNGNTETLHGCCRQVPIGIGGLRFDHIFFVKNGRIGLDYDLLFGQPWLKAAVAEICYGEVGMPDSMSLRLYEQGNTQGGSLIVNLNVNQKHEATALAHFIMQTNEGTTPIESSMPGQSPNEDKNSSRCLLLPPMEGSTREGASQDTRPTSLVCIISKSEDLTATYNQSTKQLLETIYTHRGSCNPATIGKPKGSPAELTLSTESSGLTESSGDAPTLGKSQGEVPPIIHEVLVLLNKEHSKLRNISTSKTEKKLSVPYLDNSWSVKGLQEMAETSREPKESHYRVIDEEPPNNRPRNGSTSGLRQPSGS